MAKFLVVPGLLVAAVFFAWLGTSEPFPQDLPAGTCDLMPFLCVR